ncbi:glycosyltransferase family 4 protein [Micrococcales bacterium 31B]|nr:glycosyltransferase family 4 protein [Micrococcales bacterium 31B]
MTLHTVARYGRGGASSRVRLYDWLDYLSLDAVENNYLGGNDTSLRFVIRNAGAVLRAERALRRLVTDCQGQRLILSRSASPLSSGGIEERLLRAAGHAVYDFDDALYERGRTRTNPFSLSDTWRRSCAAADVVIAGNEELASHALAVSRNVHVIPSCVNLEHYTAKTDFEIGAAPRGVWIGSASTEKYLAHIAPSLLKLHREAGLRLTVISHPQSSVPELEGLIDRVPWQASTFGSLLAQADFGIMPLTDEPWSRGKCAYKLLQYGAANLPVIGSPVGVNEQVISGMGGLAASTESEWSEALHAVIHDSAEGRSLRGRQGGEYIAQNFSFTAWGSAWKSLVLPG